VADPGEFSWPSVGSSRWPLTLRLTEPAQIRRGALQIADFVSEIGVVRCRGGHRSGRRSLRSRHRADVRPPAEMSGVSQLSHPGQPRDPTPLQTRAENDTSAYSSGPHGCAVAPTTLPNAWPSWQEPKTARSPRIARLSPAHPRRVGPPCARQRRVAAPITRTAGPSRSRGEASECADAAKVLAEVGLGSTSPSASLEVMSVPTTPVTSWPESCSPVSRARRLPLGPPPLDPLRLPSTSSSRRLSRSAWMSRSCTERW